MPKKVPEMTPLAVRNLAAPGMHFVGGADGLALKITPTGSRSWVLRITIGSKRRDMGLGAFPDVSLANAREEAKARRALARDGIDPIEDRRARLSALRIRETMAKTFRDCAEAYMKAHEVGWKSSKHAAQWQSTLATYAYPTIGDMFVRDVDKPQILAVLEPIWNTKTETANRLRGRIELVLSYAMQRGYRPEGANPARWRGGLDKLLAAPGKVAQAGHFRALPVHEAGRFMQALRTRDGTSALALEFTILTATRSGEVRGATWSEIDITARTWTIPGKRMKAGKEHRVPLSDAALAVLEKAKALPRLAGVELVFPAPKGKALSDMSLTAVTRRMKEDTTVHGFRSTFRDWSAERTAYPNEVCEMALAHSIGDKTEAAYRRGDVFEKRARMMEDWAKFLSRVEQAGQVVSLNSQRA